LLGLGEGNTNTHGETTLTLDPLGLGEEMKQTDANSSQKPNPRSAGPPPLCGLTLRRAGLEEPELAAATACGTSVLGATTEPLDGRALTHGVDARAGEGADSSTAFLHRATMGGILSVACGFKAFWWRNRGRSNKGGC
jgi:hypothetical protein